MTHYRALGAQLVSDDVRDVRGTTIRRSDGAQVGKVDDVILDHGTMGIRYLVVGDADWLEAGIFLLPADRVSVDENHEDGLATGATSQQVENAPQYDPGSLRSADEWTKYEREFKKYWEEQPVMHMKDSYRIVTPPEEPAPTQAFPINEGSRGSGDRVADAGKLFPERMTSVFFPLRRPLQRFHRTSLIEVNHGIELICETRVEVMTDPLRFRQIDHANRPFKSVLTQHTREPLCVAQYEHEPGHSGFMEERFITSGQRWSNELSFCRCIPI
jgi:sporulation protein YlmC with PRC-barrel domain